MSLLSRSLILGLFLVLTGCGVFSDNALQVPKQLQLLPPAQGPDETLLKQKVTMKAGEEERQFLAVLRLRRDKTQLVALLPTGQQILQLSYDGKDLDQNSLLGVDVPGRDILSMMQFALWPERTVFQFYPSSSGWALQMDESHRQVDNAEGPLLAVTFQKNGLTLENYVGKYKVQIETLEAQSL